MASMFYVTEPFSDLLSPWLIPSHHQAHSLLHSLFPLFGKFSSSVCMARSLTSLRSQPRVTSPASLPARAIHKSTPASFLPNLLWFSSQHLVSPYMLIGDNFSKLFMLIIVFTDIQ